MNMLAHVGISVSDMDRSIAFYQNLLGLAIAFDGRFEGERYERILKLPHASGRVALLKGPQLELELFEFEYPRPQCTGPERQVNNHGITHFCVEVDDLDGLYERLLRAGMTFHCPPIVFGQAVKATYGRDPDGTVIELVERLHRMPSGP